METIKANSFWIINIAFDVFELDEIESPLFDPEEIVKERFDKVEDVFNKRFKSQDDDVSWKDFINLMIEIKGMKKSLLEEKVLAIV